MTLLPMVRQCAIIFQVEKLTVAVFKMAFSHSYCISFDSFNDLKSRAPEKFAGLYVKSLKRIDDCM
jgi:hypothetical protein